MTTKDRSNQNASKIVLISLFAFILVFSLGSLVGIKLVYDQNFSRYEKPEFSGYLRYQDVDGYERTEVQFESGKNTLTGYLFGEENEKGLVVIVHGLGEGAENYLAETLFFVDNGWRVFAFDCTGTHQSEGEGTVGLPQSMLDLEAALTYVKGNNEMNNLPLMLYGHSWGGYAVTAILNRESEISAVVSISGFNSPMGLLGEQLQSMMGGFAFAEYPFGWAYQTMLFGSSAWITAVDGINSADIPVMIIHGDEDEAISYGGASIISHKGKITNPNSVFKTYSAENHNGHNNLFISAAASEYIEEKNQEYKVLYDFYSGKMPDHIKARYYDSVDRLRTSELDIVFMNEVNRFFEDSLVIHN